MWKRHIACICWVQSMDLCNLYIALCLPNPVIVLTMHGQSFCITWISAMWRGLFNDKESRHCSWSSSCCNRALVRRIHGLCKSELVPFALAIKGLSCKVWIHAYCAQCSPCFVPKMCYCTICNFQPVLKLARPICSQQGCFFYKVNVHSYKWSVH